MLPETKQYVAKLKEAGLSRAQFRIKTPWNQAKQQYGATLIIFTCTVSQLIPHVKPLSKFFKVMVTILDGIPCNVTLDTQAEPGLYKRENGVVELVTEIAYKGDFEQLPLWEKEGTLERIGME